MRRRWWLLVTLLVVAGLGLKLLDSKPFKPVPRDHGNWQVSHSDPALAARGFAFAGEDCDCQQLSVLLMKLHEDGGITYAVRLDGLKDDSIRTIEYRVTLQRSGELWQVDRASYRTTCRRGSDQNGYCI